MEDPQSFLSLHRQISLGTATDRGTGASARFANSPFAPKLFSHIHRSRHNRRKPQNRSKSFISLGRNSNTSVQSVRPRNRINVPILAQPPQQKHGMSGSPSHTSNPTCTKNSTRRKPSKVRSNQLMLWPEVRIRNGTPKSKKHQNQQSKNAK